MRANRPSWPKNLTSIILATAWIGFFEFLRNELLFKSSWESHYAGLGIVFPSETINNLIWGIWSLALAVLLYTVMSKFSLIKATAIVWFSAFFMMWLVIGNLAVLPIGLLVFAVPLSFIEVYIAALIINKLSRKKI